MSPDDYEKLYAEALDEPAFSNSDQGCGWMAANCDRCVHDKEQREQGTGGCPLILVSLMGKTPIQWLTQSEKDRVFANYHCIEFRDENDGPGPEPTPIPDPPGQLTLVPREQYEGHRMLTAIPQLTEVAS